MEPKDKAALRRFQECQKLARKEAFEKAIECDNGKLPSELINLAAISKISDDLSQFLIFIHFPPFFFGI